MFQVVLGLHEDDVLVDGAALRLGNRIESLLGFPVFVYDCFFQEVADVWDLHSRHVYDIEADYAARRPWERNVKVHSKLA